MLISFELATIGDDFMHRTGTLREMWWYIKCNINEPRNYRVNQIDENNDTEDSVSAYYLIENFKTEDDLPKLLSDLNHNAI